MTLKNKTAKIVISSNIIITVDTYTKNYSNSSYLHESSPLHIQSTASTIESWKRSAGILHYSSADDEWVTTMTLTWPLLKGNIFHYANSFPLANSTLCIIHLCHSLPWQWFWMECRDLRRHHWPLLWDLTQTNEVFEFSITWTSDEERIPPDTLNLPT